ncbi:MAG: acetyl-CoA carboxylase carboxyltransferase subunit alpha [Candidatus Brocadiia bacterium]|jgi:acetyl-CoA carboxylase carboxyl transferase subunit alpha|nr:acetyl-CoA carboxylase carboxyltransferase subunit alpha [Candidatus Brocadiia bacterium]
MAKKPKQAQFAYDFERPVLELDEKIELLTQQTESGGENAPDAIKQLEAQREQVLADLVANLTPYQRVKLARHPRRPQSLDYLDMIFDDFVALHGDRRFGDDKTTVTGLARLDGRGLMIVAQHKGRDTKERMEHNFGMPNPEGYRKALAKMQMAEKFAIPVVCMIDTPGAAPALEAEERGQAMAIAENIWCMSGLRTPIVVVIISEAGSGGALGMGVGDRFAMMENGYFSVITPEGCAAILWRSGELAESAAEAMKLTAQDMLGFRIIDEVITEPPGGAHRDPAASARALKSYLVRTLAELAPVPLDQLVEERYRRYRAFGEFTTEQPPEPQGSPPTSQPPPQDQPPT